MRKKIWTKHQTNHAVTLRMRLGPNWPPPLHGSNGRQYSAILIPETLSVHPGTLTGGPDSVPLAARAAILATFPLAETVRRITDHKHPGSSVLRLRSAHSSRALRNLMNAGEARMGDATLPAAQTHITLLR